MAIILRLDRVMADRKISLKDLAERVEISNVNLSNLKTLHSGCNLPGTEMSARRYTGIHRR